MQHDEKIPGVTFHLAKGEQLPPVDNRHLARGQVILDCEIDNFDVWKDVLEKLNGLRIYTVSDLAEAMVTISQKKHAELKEDFHKYKIQMNTQIQELKAENSRLTAERDAFAEANQKWADWSAALKEMSGKMEA